MNRSWSSIVVLILGVLITSIPAYTAPAAPAKKPGTSANHQVILDDADPGLVEVRALAGSGAARLAIYSLNEYQGNIGVDPGKWMAWEKERIAIMQGSQDWQGIVERLSEVPQGVSENFRRWSTTERVNALIQLKKGASAVELLQQLVWNIPEDHPQQPQWLKQWRHQILDAYLSTGAVDDALLAATHYYRDYGAASLEERLLRARILLGAGWAEEARSLLTKEKDSDMAAVLLLLAELRMQPVSARKVMKSAMRRLRSGPQADIQVLLWAIVAEASEKLADRGSHANALEHLMAAEQNLPSGLFDYDADHLWRACLDYAQDTGNKSRYLIGQDAPWFEHAAKVKRKQPVKSRSILLFLLQNGETPQNRARAAEEYLIAIKGRKDGGRILQALFLESKKYPEPTSIPLAIRYELVDVALRNSDIVLASNLMQSIETPPEGADRFFWNLRRARIFVMGGDPVQGARALDAILKSGETLSSEQIDQFLQVVFDLQTVQAHAEAFLVLQGVLPLKHDEKRLRELYYWMAESKKALHQYAEAARLYLKSAMLPEATTMDPWAQTARYQAASALAKAGLVRDARSLFQHLLRVTEDPARRSVLRHELQKLWLLQETSPQAEGKMSQSVRQQVN